MTIYVILCYAVALALMLIANCPEGYQDEKGFHYGKPPL